MADKASAGRAPTRVAATHPISEAMMSADDGSLDVVQLDISGWGQSDFINHLRGFAGVLVGTQTPMNAAVLEALAPDLRIVSSYTAGVEHIDLDAAARLGITVTNTGSMVAIPTAEIALLLILAAMRGAGPSYELIRSGGWDGLWARAPSGAELNRKTLGIVGMGSIGTEVAKRALPFGMTVVYHNRNRLPAEREHGAHYIDSLSALLQTSDIVSLHCPLNEHTREMINAETLTQMRLGAVLINTARGELLDESAVIAALEAQRLTAIGLDVYVGEPNVNPYFLKSDRVFTLPHIGTATPESRLAMGRHAIENLVRFFAGDPLQDVLVDAR
jgi:lactate dehydrogenase-like 2-hydroxyacid dehydrogenase